MFSRQLAVMFAANVPMVDSLRTVGAQVANQSFREKILRVSQTVEAGSPLSAALAKYPDIFSAFFVAMVKAGEVSGNLSEQLNYLADYLEKQYSLAGKIKGAMVYPAVIVAVMFGVLFLLSYFVMPNLTSMLIDSGAELPPLTQFVIGFTNFIRGVGGVITGGGLIVVMGSLFAHRRREKILRPFVFAPAGFQEFAENALREPVRGQFVNLDQGGHSHHPGAGDYRRDRGQFGLSRRDRQNRGGGAQGASDLGDIVFPSRFVSGDVFANGAGGRKDRFIGKKFVGDGEIL